MYGAGPHSAEPGTILDFLPSKTGDWLHFFAVVRPLPGAIFELGRKVA
jgi:hypothetical protein